MECWEPGNLLYCALWSPDHGEVCQENQWMVCLLSFGQQDVWHSETCYSRLDAERAAEHRARRQASRTGAPMAQLSRRDFLAAVDQSIALYRSTHPPDPNRLTFADLEVGEWFEMDHPSEEYPGVPCMKLSAALGRHDRMKPFYYRASAPVKRPAATQATLDRVTREAQVIAAQRRATGETAHARHLYEYATQTTDNSEWQAEDMRAAARAQVRASECSFKARQLMGVE